MKLQTMLCLLLAAVMLLGTVPARAEDSASGVTYEIFVASFYDSNGDGCGDLRGVIEKLDYIESLGVSRIWLMPIHPSPSYHKYDVTDYYAIAPEYGTMEDFDALIAACRERGIGVIMDLVVNHSSSEHPWFKQACQALLAGEENPYLDWYNFAQDGCPAPHIVPDSQDWYYEGQFGYHMPDLNLSSPQVRQEIARIMSFWQKRGVAGFRLDAVTSYYTGAPESIKEFLSFITNTAKANDPNAYVVGEAWTDAVSIVNFYASGIDSLFNFPASDNNGRLVKSALNGTGAAAAVSLADWNKQLRAVSAAAVDAPFLTNHDQARVRGMLRSDVTKQKVAAMLYLLLPGYPTVYYGEEIGMSGSGKDENKRLPMVWSTAKEAVLCNAPAGADQKQRLKEGVDVQQDDPDSLLNCYRQLIAMRSLAPELIHGAMTAMDAGHDAVCWYTVVQETGKVSVLVNCSAAETVTVDISVLGDALLLGKYGDAILDAQTQTVTLPAASCVLLRY